MIDRADARQERERKAEEDAAADDPGPEAIRASRPT